MAIDLVVSHEYCGSGDNNAFRLLRDLTRPSDQRVMWLYGQESIKVSYHSAKFGGQGPNGGENIVILVCHVISQYHMIKGSCDFKRYDPIKVGYHPSKFGGRRHSERGDIVVSFCHVILQDHMIKGSCDFMGSIPSRQVKILPVLVVIGTVVSQQI